MKNLAIREQKNRYVVRSKMLDHATGSKKLLQELADLRNRVSKVWRGPHNAVEEIREQRGGAL